MSGGKKFDQDKPPMHLLSGRALRQIADVLRHLTAINNGEMTDPESGLPHAAHAGCCIMFLLDMQEARPDLNDLYQGASE